MEFISGIFFFRYFFFVHTFIRSWCMCAVSTFANCFGSTHGRLLLLLPLSILVLLLLLLLPFLKSSLKPRVRVAFLVDKEEKNSTSKRDGMRSIKVEHMNKSEAASAAAAIHKQIAKLNTRHREPSTPHPIRPMNHCGVSFCSIDYNSK